MKSKSQLTFDIPEHVFPPLTAGIDEAGRGAWAGPVVAGAVIPQGAKIRGIKDSKLLKPKDREALFEKIIKRYTIGVGMRDASFVDEYGIKRATHEAMLDAVGALSSLPEYLIIDGNDNFKFEIPNQCVIDGDLLYHAIGAASIIAKVTRDRMMVNFAGTYKQYSFERHKGYGTQIHQENLKKHGLCPIHRRTYIHILDT